MHLVENYALTAGVKIGRPHIEPLFYPLSSKKYITLHAGSGMGSKNYDYYSNVLDTISPYLKDLDIEIYQIGEEGEKEIRGAKSLLGKTSLRQSFYVLMNSTLHIGNDSFSAHISSFYNVPTVILYGPVLKETCKPFWGEDNNLAMLSPDYTNTKPSYSGSERIKRINTISPDLVSQKALDLIGVKNNLSDIQHINIGQNYYLRIVDLVPNFSPIEHRWIAFGETVNIRCDYSPNHEFMEEWLENYKSTIYINTEIDLQLLKKHKHSISKISIELCENISKEYIEKLASTGIRTSLRSRDKKNIADIRIEYFNHNVYLIEPGLKKDIPNYKKINSNTQYDSSLILLSNNERYTCKAALDQNIKSTDSRNIIDHPDFYFESDFFKIYNKNT